MKRNAHRGAVNLLVLAILLIAGAMAGNVFWGKPADIDTFFERAFLRLAMRYPQLLTQVGILESMGMHSHNSRLDDPSDEFGEESLRLQGRELETMRSYDRAALTPAQQLSYDIADYFWESQQQGERFRFHNYPVNQLFGAQNQQPAFMINVHPVKNAVDADRYNDRLYAFGEYFDKVLANLDRREKMGIMPPRFVVEKVLVGMKGLVQPAPREHPLFTNLRDKLAKLPGADAAKREEILKRTQTAIDESVYPAYRRLIAHHEALLPRTTTDDGVWKLPDGDAFYAFKLRESTTTDLTPEEVHQLGLREVARIDKELDAALRSVGRANGTVGERLGALARDQSQRYPDNTQATKDRVIADFSAILDEVNRRIDPAFSVRPKGGVEVRAVEPFREKTSALAFYQPGTLDGSRKGIFFANTRNVHDEMPKFIMKTIAYHEGIPGHYFQIAVAQELKGVPTFRKVLPFTAYAEGWGLYSEKLAYEQGMYKDDPYGNIGRLQAEIWRAVRLVVDTGIHAKRWTRENAIKYMEEATGQTDADIVVEIERYIVTPGQASSYKVGELKILELRERAMKALGPRFDIRKFHAVVLENGSLPLAILERVVDRYIAEEKR